LTKTPGAERQFVSRNLLVGEKYPYVIRAEVERNGKKITQTKVVDLYAGLNKKIGFDFSDTPELITSVTLSVPDDAKVVLGGVKTKTDGPIRYYSTKELQKGDSWEDYTVEVSVVRNGKTIKKSKTMQIEAGESVKLSFNFDTASPEVIASK
jgi:uncharacterized protein (TIGR03000 family)